MPSTGSPSTYTVQAGDVLTSIVLKLGLCTKGPGNTIKDWENCLDAAQKLANSNGIADFNKISIGQVLKLPSREPPSGGAGKLLALLGVGAGLAFFASRTKAPSK